MSKPTFPIVYTDLGTIEFVFQQDLSVNSFFNIKTGEIIIISGEESSEEEEAAYDIIDKDYNNFLKIPHMESWEGYQYMADFIDTLNNDVIIEKLSNAISGKGAFRRFKDALFEYPEIRKKWFYFEDAKLQKRINEWSEDNKLKLVQKNKH